MNTKNTATSQMKDTVSDQMENVENVINNAEETVETYKGKVSNNLSNIADKVHKKADSSQEFLDNKTDELGNYVHQTVQKANDLGHQAAAAINDSSEYIRNFDIQKAGESVKVAIKEKPEVVVAAAALLGLLVGFLVGRKTA